MLGRVSCGMRLVWIFKGVWYGGCGSSGRSDFYVGWTGSVGMQSLSLVDSSG